VERKPQRQAASAETCLHPGRRGSWDALDQLFAHHRCALYWITFQLLAIAQMPGLRSRRAIGLSPTTLRSRLFRVRWQPIAH
jgi:hypothetical protein